MSKNMSTKDATFGKANRPSTPIQGVISGSYMADQAERGVASKKEAKIDYDRLANTAAKTKNFVELGFALEYKNYEKWLGLGKTIKKSSERQDEGKKIKL